MREPGMWHMCCEAGFAKVNLALRILGRRPDGYHDIRTVFQSVELYDDVNVWLRMGGPPSVTLQCNLEGLNHEGNLAWRAADLLLQRLRLNAQVRIGLKKRIPVGSGLGGGSSDAGAVLRAISNLLVEPPSRDVLLDVAKALGSDVPYFLVGGTAVATGRGTDVTPVRDLHAAWTVLALPDIEVSTAWAYQTLSESRAGLTSSGARATISGSDWGSPPPSLGDLESLAEWMLNDFEGVVFRQYPALREIKRQILAGGARHALLSGSGSALFGVFDSLEAASRAAGALAAQGVRAEAARFLSRADCGLALEMDK